MKITLRLIVSLVVVATSIAVLFSTLQVRRERSRLAYELEHRANVLTDTLSDSAEILLRNRQLSKLQKLLANLNRKERLAGVVFYGPDGSVGSKAGDLPSDLMRPLDMIELSIREKREIGGFEEAGGRQLYVYSRPITADDKGTGALVLFHDASYINARLNEIWKNNFIRLLILSVFIIITTLLVIRWDVVRPVEKAAEWVKRLRMGETRIPPDLASGDILEPLVLEVHQMARSLSAARAAAEKEAQLRLLGESVWTPEKLKEHVRSQLGNKTLYVVSNREPYMHVRQKRKLELIVPPSGLVTALEPVLRACGGMWIAHGSGDADREVVDSEDKVRVPPDEPAYVLKRVWLSKEEEDGHYYGFSNEGLWPLCHITHTRPIFRLNDWLYYQRVNQKFADALLEEIGEDESPLILIQDYHFALLPLLIRQKKPDARIALFWHIPWPNPESFSICPWKKELLLGMLSSDIVGFHIQQHCNNFLDTVDNVLESKIDWEHFSVERGGRLTQVQPFPISVGWDFRTRGRPEDIANRRVYLRESLAKEHGINAERLGVGVDRLDYTKGILERFKAIERFFEKYPEYLRRFTFVELGAPSRTHIQNYHDFIAEVEKTVEKINWKFQAKDWKPLVFLKAQHSRAVIEPFYKAADICLVTSLHDGMNLVAKEFVSARDDGDGALILSQFTGASRELPDALIVNPYDTEAMSECIRLALEMPEEERKDRMKRMRRVIQEKNIYRWAADLISAMANLPRKTPVSVGEAGVL